MFATLLLITPAALGTTAKSQAQPVQEIDNCGVIDEPGRYVLSSDIANGGQGDGFTFASQSCVVVRSDDVVIDGRGHRIDALGNSDTTGVAVAGSEGDPVENVTIRNVALTDWNRGIYFRHVENGTVRKVDLRTNAYGMSVEHSDGVRVTDADVEDNLIGVYVAGGSSGTEFSNMSFTGNYAGDVVDETASNESTGTESNGTGAAAGTATNATATATPTPERARSD